jgi:hypothetical protein
MFNESAQQPMDGDLIELLTKVETGSQVISRIRRVAQSNIQLRLRSIIIVHQLRWRLHAFLPLLYVG